MIAYFFHLIYKKERVENKDILIISVCTAIIAPIKVVYIVIIGLGILIPYQKFERSEKVDMRFYIRIGRSDSNCHNSDCKHGRYDWRKSGEFGITWI